MVSFLEGLYKAWVVMWQSDGVTLFFAGAVIGIFFFLILMTMRDKVRGPPYRAHRRGLVQFSPTEFPGPYLALRPPEGSSQATLSGRSSVQTGRVARALLPPRSTMWGQPREVPASTVWDSVWRRRAGMAPKRGAVGSMAPKPVMAPKRSRWGEVKRLLAPKRYREPVAPKSGLRMAPKALMAPNLGRLKEEKGSGRARRIIDTLVPPPDKQKKRKKGKEAVVLDEGVPDRRYIDLGDVK